MTERKIVIPGETIATGEDYLPGKGTEKKGNEIVAMVFGLAEEENNLIKVIPLAGKYEPRRGNVIIGRVEMLTHNGWVMDFGNAENAFLSLMEVPRFVDKGALDEVMDIGDMVVVKIYSIKGRSIDVTIKERGLGKIEEGIIFKINPNKVPRVIGKEGSMIKIIKDETNCKITVGQNGIVWIRGENVEDELFSKKAINFVTDRTFISGLTDKVSKFLSEEKNGGKK